MKTNLEEFQFDSEESLMEEKEDKKIKPQYFEIN
jgi:hypothetical protein